MFGPRITTVFRSRWRAIWFVLSVLIGVYFSVPRQGDDASDSGKSVQAIAALLQQQQPSGQPADAHKHFDPWAKTQK